MANCCCHWTATGLRCLVLLRSRAGLACRHQLAHCSVRPASLTLRKGGGAAGHDYEAGYLLTRFFVGFAVRCCLRKSQQNSSKASTNPCTTFQLLTICPVVSWAWWARTQLYVQGLLRRCIGSCARACCDCAVACREAGIRTRRKSWLTHCFLSLAIIKIDPLLKRLIAHFCMPCGPDRQVALPSFAKRTLPIPFRD